MTHRHPEELLTAYLADGMHVLPDRVIDDVMGEVHRTRQRTGLGRRRTPLTIAPMKAAVAAAAVVVLAVAGTTVLPSITGPRGIGGPEPSAAPSRTSIPVPTATPRLPFKQPLGLAIVGLDGTVRQDLRMPLDAWMPDLAPDGTRIAFLTFSQEVAVCPGACSSWRRLVAVGADGSNAYYIYPDADPDTDMDELQIDEITQSVWSPDGTRLAFQASSPPDGNIDIYSATLEIDDDLGIATAHATRLTFDPAVDEFPAWAPDGSSIVYVNRGSDPGESDISPTQEIWRVPAAGGEPTRLTDNEEPDGQPDVSRDGRVAFWRGGDVWSMELDGSDQTRLVIGPGGWAPRWSPDASRIAVLRLVEGERAYIEPLLRLPMDLPLLEVVVIDLATGDNTSVGPRVASFFNRVSWTPDGTALLIARFDERP